MPSGCGTMEPATRHPCEQCKMHHACSKQIALERRTELGVCEGELALHGRLLDPAPFGRCAVGVGSRGAAGDSGGCRLRALTGSCRADQLAPCAVPRTVHTHTPRPNLHIDITFCNVTK